MVANSEQEHNVIVCTLCSCYPIALLGPSPTWYKSEAYRSRVVRDPRARAPRVRLRAARRGTASTSGTPAPSPGTWCCRTAGRHRRPRRAGTRRACHPKRPDRRGSGLTVHLRAGDQGVRRAGYGNRVPRPTRTSPTRPTVGHPKPSPMHARADQLRQALTVMFCVAAFVLAADTISKTLVLRDLPGRPPVRLLDGLITLRLLYNPGAAFGLGTSYTVIIALIALGVIVFVDPHGPAAGQHRLVDRARPAARRGDRQSQRPAGAGTRAVPRPRGRLDQPAALPVDVQPGRLGDRLRGRADRVPGLPRQAPPGHCDHVAEPKASSDRPAAKASRTRRFSGTATQPSAGRAAAARNQELQLRCSVVADRLEPLELAVVDPAVDRVGRRAGVEQHPLTGRVRPDESIVTEAVAGVQLELDASAACRSPPRR